MPSRHDKTVSSAGFEPAISTLRGWRPLHRPTRTSVAQEGFEPSAFLFLREDGLPVAYRAERQSGSWSRTNIASFKARQPTFSRSPNTNEKGQASFVTPGPCEKQGSCSVSQAQTINQLAAQALTADTADILAFHNLVQRAGHLLISPSPRADSQYVVNSAPHIS